MSATVTDSAPAMSNKCNVCLYMSCIEVERSVPRYYAIAGGKWRIGGEMADRGLRVSLQLITVTRGPIALFFDVAAGDAVVVGCQRKNCLGFVYPHGERRDERITDRPLHGRRSSYYL